MRLYLHIGVGCGEISILQVGGVVPPETHIGRIEYLISGAPLEQISIAEPLAKNGETCLSPQAWELVKDCVIEGRPLEERSIGPGYINYIIICQRTSHIYISQSDVSDISDISIYLSIYIL